MSENNEPVRGKFYFNEASKTFEREAPKRVEVNAPYVKRDEIVGGIESWVDGKVYDSKSKLRQSYKEHGVIEKGNDRLPPKRQPTDEETFLDVREDTLKTYQGLKYDNVFVTEKEKESCKMELRALRKQNKRRMTRWAR